MKCDECGKQITSDSEYEEYHIQCRACFDKCHSLISYPGDGTDKVEWIGYKKFEIEESLLEALNTGPKPGSQE
jgi:hypothetical protein